MPAMWGAPNFNPCTAIEGDPTSPIWIISLNPKTNPKTHEKKSGKTNPITWENLKRTVPEIRRIPHFRRLEDVIGKVRFEEILQPKGIAHTDVLKCGSPAFTVLEKPAVDFCIEFFLSQLKIYKPKILLVNSSDASRIIASTAKLKENVTEGLWDLYGPGKEPLFLIFSGYTSSHQERYAKLRLARDFDSACKSRNL